MYIALYYLYVQRFSLKIKIFVKKKESVDMFVHTLLVYMKNMEIQLKILS